MGGMTDTPDRVALHYTGTRRVTIPESANPVPRSIEPDSIVVVNGWVARALQSTDGPTVWAPPAGDTLDAALRAAGLPTSGTADEKRARLAQNDPTLTPTDDDEQEQNRG